MKDTKKLPSLPDREEATSETEDKTILKVVPDNFPIESYIDGNGNTVVCIKESDYKAQVLANIYESKEALQEIANTINQ